MFTKSQVYNYEIKYHFSYKRIIFSTVSQNMTETCNDFRIYRLLRSHFLKKKTWKNAIFRIYRPLPYSSRDGLGSFQPQNLGFVSFESFESYKKKVTVSFSKLKIVSYNFPRFRVSYNSVYK